ncbi:hypothetical protein CHARACLAT_033166 [Characodon lateralis]|uniref:Uncharacterized protein n=1 Tax=Characodon lateralis TaxID=208331 RepID=A0ABU7F833_9TELE|nr:hypothetical protein [Characodon lateralis]
MSVCQQKDINQFNQCPTSFAGGLLARWVFKQQYSLLVSVLGCAGSRLMRFILKVPEKFLLAFSVVTHGWPPNTQHFFWARLRLKRCCRIPQRSSAPAFRTDMIWTCSLISVKSFQLSL